MNDLKRLWSWYKPYKNIFFIAIFLHVFISAAVLVPPWILKQIVDLFSSSTSMSNSLSRPELVSQITQLVFILLAGVTAHALLVFVYMRMIFRVVQNVQYDMRNSLVRHIFSLSWPWFAKQRTGDIMARCVNDLESVHNLFAEAVPQLINVTITSIAWISLLMATNWRLACITLAPITLILPLERTIGPRIHKLFSQVQEQFGKLSSHVQENINGIRIIKSFRAEEKEITRLSRASREYVDNNLKLIRIWSALEPALGFLGFFSVFLLIVIGGRAVLAGRLTLGTLVLFNMVLMRISMPVRSIGWVINIYQRGMASWKRIAHVLDTKPEIHDTNQTDYGISAINGQINLNDVSMTYPNKSEPALDKIKLDIPAGKIIVLTGPVGSGKSTLLQLICRLFEPDSGQILVDGVPLDKIPLAVLRRSVGYVPQENFLFSETISENIGMSMERATDREIRAASIIARLDEEILEFPHGYDQVVGERGITLSGGQRQRTSIARALARRPAIFLLDDPLSSVDTETESDILQKLVKRVHGATVLLVTQRARTMALADLIVVLRKGRILEQGTWEKLHASGGWVAAVWKKQMVADKLSGEDA